MPTAAEWTAASEPVIAQRKTELERLIESVKHQMRLIRILQADENYRHKKATEEIASAVREMQWRCPHTKTTYVSDPSGNSDSDDTCDLCGQDMMALRKNENARKYREQQKGK